MALPVLAESPVLSRVESTADQAWISVKGLENVSGESATVFGALARAGVNVDVIVQAPEFGGSGGVGVAFTCPQREGDRAVGALLAMSGWEVGRGRQVGKVTLWGGRIPESPANYGGLHGRAVREWDPAEGRDRLGNSDLGARRLCRP